MTQPAITLDHVRAALALPAFDAQAAWGRMSMRPAFRRDGPPEGETARLAGVLVLLYPAPADGALTTVLMRRTPDPGVHSGQIGFPGGSWEADDPDMTATALREACEEIGVCEEALIVLGSLTPVYIPPSQFLVYPTVAHTSPRPVWQPDPKEVADLLELRLPDLLDEARKRQTDMTLHGTTFRVPYYDVAGHVVWGATALMLSEFETRLKTVLGS